MTGKEDPHPDPKNEEGGDPHLLEREAPEEWERAEGPTAAPVLNPGNPFLRKAGASLLVLAGVGLLILVGRIYLKVPEDPSGARFPLHPSSQSTGDSSQSGNAPGGKGEIRKQETAPPGGGAAGRGGTIPSVSAGPGKPVSSPPGEANEEKGSDFPLKESKAMPASVSQPAKTERDSALRKRVTVKGGESIYTIAGKNYGVANTSVVERILESNRQISSPGKLLANQKILLPDITEEALLIAAGDGTYRIRLGTFLKPQYAAFLKGEPVLRGREVEITAWKLASGEIWYRATAGKFRTREEGLKAVRELREKGLSPYFVGFRKDR